MDDDRNFVNPLGDVERWTPVHTAVEMSEYEVLTALLDAGADPNELCFGHTLLTHSIDVEGDGHLQSGHLLNTAATAILLAYGADPRLPAADGETPCRSLSTTTTNQRCGCSNVSSHAVRSLRTEPPGRNLELKSVQHLCAEPCRHAPCTRDIAA